MTNTGEKLQGTPVFKWVHHVKNTSNIPSNSHVNTVNDVKKNIQSYDMASTKNSIDTFSITDSSSFGNNSLYSGIGVENGSNIDPDNYNDKGKKIYNVTKGESTRMNSKTPDINDLIKRSEQQVQSAYN